MAFRGTPYYSAVQDTPLSTDVFAPAGTSATGRWRCAGTVYNDRTREGDRKEMDKDFWGGGVSG